MNKVAIYCRLSDEDRNKNNSFDDSESIQNQKNLLTKYAINNEWDIFKIYSDDDFSGLDSDRPEWNQMIRDAEQKKFNIILCKTQARFTRNMEIVERYLHHKFAEWNIRFIGVADNADTENRGNKKQRQIMGLTNEWYCEDVSDSIRAVFDNKRHEGQFIGSFAAYGYLKDPKNRNRLVVDEEAAQVIKMIFNWYLDGYGTQHIAFMLNEKGILNPTKYKQEAGLKFINSSVNNGLGLWNKTTVKRILKNEVYIGNMVQGKRKKVSYKSKKIIPTSRDQWIKVENTHEPIVEKKVFDEVQRRINQRQRSTGEGKAHIFSTKVRCADCGNTMNKVTTFRGNMRLYSYLKCKISTVTGNKSLCTSHAIRLDYLEDIVRTKLKEYIDTFLEETTIASKLQAEGEIRRQQDGYKSQMVNIEKQISQNSVILKNLYFDKVNGIITNEQFVDLNKSLLQEKGSLNARKKELEKAITQLMEKSRDISDWIGVIKQYKNFEKLTYSMANEFINYIEIGEKNKETGEQRVRIHWAF